MKRKKCITITRVEGIFLFLIAAEGVDLVYDLGRIFQKVIRPYVAPDDQTLDQALTRFVAYYEQSEMFDLYTHGTGPDIVGVIVNLLKSYLEGCVYSKLERHHTLDPTSPCPLTAYVEKIGNIVKMVVCEPEDGELPQGKLAKMEEQVKKDEEKKKKKKKHKSNVKFTDRKSSKPASSEEASEDSEAELVVSSDEEDFTTLTSGDGRKQYRPPDKTRSEARFGANKKKGGSDPIKSLQHQLGNMSRKMSNYKCEISRLTKEVNEQRKKLDGLEGADKTMKGKQSVSSQGRIGKAALQTYGEWEMTGAGFDPSFVNTQLRQELESNSEEVQGIEDPDSTTGVGKKKKKKQKKKRDIDMVEVGDDDENDDDDDDRVYTLLGKSQTGKRRHRISSKKSSVAVEGGGSKRVDSEGDPLLPENSEDKDLDTLRQERDQVEEKLHETKRKLEELMWDERARGYHEVVRVYVQRFHKALMNNLRKREESAEVKKVRGDLERCTVTEAAEGFKLGVCVDFIERIEKTVLIGEIPENKLDLTKIDNSVNNIVEGFVRDVTYKLAVPVVVKQEKVDKMTAEDDDEDNDLEIVGYTKATIVPVSIQEVKIEPPSPPPASPKNQEEKQVRAPEQPGTPQKEVSEVAEAETSTGGTKQKEVPVAGTPQKKKPKKKGVSSATEEGETSVQSTPTKEQEPVEDTEMETQDIDIESTQSPEKAEASKAKRSKKTPKIPEDCARRVTRSSKPK